LTEDFISMDVEKFLINKLKLLCGIQFTANVEGMINDYNLNKDLNEKYKIWMKENKNNNVIDSQVSKIFYYIKIVSNS
jgi:hypothetical protein